ncbi:MAG: SpoIIE family protein phosphatase [Anaerolineales bacterium]|nr:SpoIIE family protein phosphatase [Anaerolineales bacterium]MCB9003959.1 SpoIIE family protein phosphatase [Ardenticatenaceae bacterium]
MRERLTAIAQHFSPELTRVTGEIRAVSLVAVGGTLYGLPLALAGLLWLAWRTDWQLFLTNWPLFLLLLLLHGILSQFDFSTIFESDSVRVRGTQGRMLTWSMALLFGPSVLWIELLSTSAQVLLRHQPSASTPFLQRQRRWDQMRYLTVMIARETLSILPALWLYEQWGGVLPLADLSGTAVLPALYATLIKSLLFAVIMTPVLFIIVFAKEGQSLLDLLRTFRRFWLAVLLFYLLPDPFGVLAAGIYTSSGLSAYLFFFAGILLVSYLAHRLSRTALRYQRRARELALLEQFTQAILVNGTPDVDLATLLQRYVPELLPHAWVEVRLFPDETLYRSDRDGLPQPIQPSEVLRPSLDDTIWQALSASLDPYLLLRDLVPEERREGVLVPILSMNGRETDNDDESDRDRIGGLCALPHGYGGAALDALPALRSLAALIASVLHQQAEYEEALAAQAEAYREELFAQAYQAEVYAQALAYRKMTQELEVAGRIQTSFLPQTVPDMAGWQLAVALEPARETSGDFYDIIPLGNGRYGLVVADVADKGIGPALYMALSRTLIRTFADQFANEPERVLSAANRRILADTVNDLFVTVFYAVLDIESGQLTYCNAGHNPPFLLQSQNGSAPSPLLRTALPLGIMPDVDWGRASVQMAPGDVLVIYTDGVTEAQDEDEQFFGEERLQTIVRANIGRSADIIEDKLVSAIYDFVGDAPQYDDITLMVLVRET